MSVKSLICAPKTKETPWVRERQKMDSVNILRRFTVF